MKHIGSGHFKDVYAHPDDREKVVKEHKIRITPEERHMCHLLLGMEFYLTKILSTLYPEQISDIHAAGIGEDGTLQTIHDKQQVDNIVTHAIRFFLDLATYTDASTKKNRFAVSETLRSSGVNVDDLVVKNFGTNKAGNPIFIDSPYRSSLPTILHTKKDVLLQIIEALPDTDERKKTCAALLSRFTVLMDMYKAEGLTRQKKPESTPHTDS